MVFQCFFKDRDFLELIKNHWKNVVVLWFFNYFRGIDAFSISEQSRKFKAGELWTPEKLQRLVRLDGFAAHMANVGPKVGNGAPNGSLRRGGSGLRPTKTLASRAPQNKIFKGF